MKIKIVYIGQTDNIHIRYYNHRCSLCGKEMTANCNGANWWRLFMKVKVRKIINVKFIPSDYMVDEWYHVEDRSLIRAIMTKGHGVKNKFMTPKWEEL